MGSDTEALLSFVSLNANDISDMIFKITVSICLIAQFIKHMEISINWKNGFHVVTQGIPDMSLKKLLLYLIAIAVYYLMMRPV